MAEKIETKRFDEGKEKELLEFLGIDSSYLNIIEIFADEDGIYFYLQEEIVWENKDVIKIVFKTTDIFFNVDEREISPENEKLTLSDEWHPCEEISIYKEESSDDSNNNDGNHVFPTDKNKPVFWKEAYYVKDYRNANLQEIDGVLNAGKAFDDQTEKDSSTGQIRAMANISFSLEGDYNIIKFKKNGSDSSPYTIYRKNGFFTIPKNASFYAGEISFGIDSLFYYQKNGSNVFFYYLDELNEENNRSRSNNYYYNFFNVAPEFRAKNKNMIGIQRAFKEEEGSEEGFHTSKKYKYNIQQTVFESDKLKFLGLQESPFVFAYSTEQGNQHLAGISLNNKKAQGRDCDAFSFPEGNIYLICRKVNFSLSQGLASKTKKLEEENSLFVSTNDSGGAKRAIVRWTFSSNRRCKIIAKCDYDVYKLKNGITDNELINALGIIADDPKAYIIDKNGNKYNLESCFELIGDGNSVKDSILSRVFIEEENPYTLELLQWDEWDNKPNYKAYGEYGFVGYNYNPTGLGGSKYPAGSIDTQKKMQVSCEIQNYKYLPGSKIQWKYETEIHQHDVRYGISSLNAFSGERCYLAYSNHLMNISTTDPTFFPKSISLIFDNEENGSYTSTKLDSNTYGKYYAWCENYEKTGDSLLPYNYADLLQNNKDYYVYIAGANCVFNGSGYWAETSNTKNTYAWYVVIDPVTNA